MAQATAHDLNVEDLAGRPHQAILKLAAPTVFAMLLQSLVNEIDIIFFRELPGCDSINAQAALLPSLLMVWLFGGSLSAIGVGTQAHTARRFAEGDFRAVGQVISNTLWFCVVGGLVMMTLGSLTIDSLLSRGVSGPALEVAKDYSHYRLFGIISMATTIGTKSFFDGIGKTGVHFWASSVMNIFNVLFCYMFIFGEFGAPRLGAAGAGLGALLATWIGLAIMLLFLWRERERFHLAEVWRPSKKLITSIFALGAPAAVATILMMAGFFLYTSFAGTLDSRSTNAVVSEACGVTSAVNGAATSNIVGVMKLTFTAAIGFGTATATLVGQSLGRKRYDLAKLFGWSSVRLGLGIFGVVGLFEGLLATDAIIGFITDSPEVFRAMQGPLRIMGLVTPIIAVAMILSEALFGAGSTRFVAAAQGILVFGVLIPVAWYLSLKTSLGLSGMWIAAAVYAVLAAVTMSLKFRGGSWQKISL